MVRVRSPPTNAFFKWKDCQEKSIKIGGRCYQAETSFFQRVKIPPQFGAGSAILGTDTHPMLQNEISKQDLDAEHSPPISKPNIDPQSGFRKVLLGSRFLLLLIIMGMAVFAFST
ncbi:hypothetical protein [Shimia thalassica]|uniref:hypothetical protein n=1 Tax=Shimia thalassica TaxID=1715693 RepID=UPI002733F08D|nr:hypothetical protein [Shimia thalassica]MDP2520846.1 hypothetical protein [Shimia thalassica]